MSPPNFAIGVCIEDEHALDLDAFAMACGVDVAFVRLLVDEGLLKPSVEQPDWRFGGEALTRARRVRRLQRAFEANLQSVAVILDLLDECDRLREQLRRGD